MGEGYDKFPEEKTNDEKPSSEIVNERDYSERANKPKRFFHWLRKYGVDKKEPVLLSAEQRAEKTGDENVLFNPNERINAYLDDFQDVFLNPDFEQRQKTIEALRPFLYNAYVISEENFPESFFKTQQRYLSGGQISSKPEITPEYKKSMYEMVAINQKRSLDEWLNFLISEDNEKYSTAIRYFVFKEALKLDALTINRDKGPAIYSFGGRKPGDNTLNPYPKPDKPALSLLMDTFNNIYESEESTSDTENNSSPTQIEKLVKLGADFGDIYAEAIKELDETFGGEERWKVTEGEWKTFSKGSNYKELMDSLGNSSNLCIGNEVQSAISYLDNSDMLIYFSKDRNGNNTFPRLAIRMFDGQVIDINGTYNQNKDIDPYIHDVLKDKLDTLPNGHEYFERIDEMKQLTIVEEKVKAKQELTEEDIIFLFELNGDKIDNFGIRENPRIILLRSDRFVFEQLYKISNSELKNKLIERFINDCTQDKIVPSYLIQILYYIKQTGDEYAISNLINNVISNNSSNDNLKKAYESVFESND